MKRKSIQGNHETDDSISLGLSEQPERRSALGGRLRAPGFGPPPLIDAA